MRNIIKRQDNKSKLNEVKTIEENNTRKKRRKKKIIIPKEIEKSRPCIFLLFHKNLYMYLYKIRM